MGMTSYVADGNAMREWERRYQKQRAHKDANYTPRDGRKCEYCSGKVFNNERCENCGAHHG